GLLRARAGDQRSTPKKSCGNFDSFWQGAAAQTPVRRDQYAREMSRYQFPGSSSIKRLRVCPDRPNDGSDADTDLQNPSKEQILRTASLTSQGHHQAEREAPVRRRRRCLLRRKGCGPSPTI